jgi:hypothetical protein
MSFAVPLTVLFSACAPSHPPAVAAAPTFHVQIGTTIDLNAYRASLPAPGQNGHTRSRLGEGCGNCWTTVSISAYSWAKNYGAANFPANPGDMYPIGHIVNSGPVTTDMYSLKTNAYAEYDIYITNDAGAAAWQIIEVPNAATGQLSIRSKGKLHSCGHSAKPKSEADFRNCDYGPQTKGEIRLAGESGLEELVARLLSRRGPAFMVGEDPGWISCTEGCCTLSAT